MTDSAGEDESMSPKVERLIMLATVSAVADTMTRTRRLKLIARLVQIANDWERENNVIELHAPRRRAEADGAMRKAASQLRKTADLLRLDSADGVRRSQLNPPSPTTDRT